MKKIVLLFLFIFIFKSSNGQQYYPFPTSNAFWVEYRQSNINDVPGSCSKIQHTIVGDTMINSTVYHKLEVSQVNYFYPYAGMCVMDSIVASYPNSYEGAFREDTVLKRIYCIQAADSNEILLYDFNAGVNDTIYTDLTSPCGGFPVTSIDSVLVGGNYHKQYNCSDCYPPFNSIIEGVGSTAGLFGYWCSNFEGGQSLICFNSNNMGAYPDGSSCDPLLGIENVIKEASVKIFPNPSTGMVHLTFSDNFSLKNISVFNSLGEQIIERNILEIKADFDFSSYSKGVYFFKIMCDDKINMQKFILM